VVPQETELALESERNYLRLLAFAYPARLEQVARRSSEELAVMSAVMRRYTSGPFAGRGWFGSELSPHIRATALREHAPPVLLERMLGGGVLFGVRPPDHEVGPGGRQPLGHAQADAAVAAGDDGDLARQVEQFHLRFPLF